MSWFNLWDGLKTKTCRYLLQRYLGQFFENNLNLEQLKVDLYNGKAVVENISLKVNALNELFEEQGWAFEVISGHIGCLTAMVPWNALMTNDSSLNISDLTITLRPVTRSQSGTTMLESMWSSVSSSMQMAEECMKQVDDDIPFLNHSNTLIGLEKFAETIDNVLNRIHANLTNTTLNIEYTLPTSFQKLIISFKANHVEYKNQTGYEKYTNLSKDPGIDIESEDRPQILTSLPMIARHQLVTNELTVWTSEIINNEVGSTGQENTGLLCKIVEFKGCQNFKISIKQTENIVGPKVNLEIIIDDIYFLLTPRQTHLLIRISKGFNKDRPKDIMVKQYKDIKTDISNIVPHPTKMTGFIKKGSEWSNEGDSRKSEHLLNDFKTTKNVESTIYATTANSMATSCSNTQINSGSSEKSGEILKFKIQIFKMLGVLLHNDILLENTITNNVPKYIITDKSFLNYSHIADAFFPSTRQKGSLEDGFTPILNHNYLLLMVSSLLVNGNQQRYYQELTLKTTLSATMVDFSEIIDNTPNHLIAFDRKKNCNNGYHIRPEVILSHTSSFLLKQNSNRCNNKVECFFDDCTTDLDISIYDRLSSLFGSSPFDKQSDCSDVILEVSNSMDIEIKCNLLKLHLRFPIVDGRLPVDPKKVPFWQKNIRNDYLSFDFQNILVKWNSILSVAIDEVDGFYCDMDFQNNIHFIKCSSRNILKNSAPVTETILVKVHNQDATRLCSENRQKQKRKSPFSSKCSYEYSSNVEGLHDSTDKREIFLPGDTEEINEFCESSKNSSGTTIYVFIPKVKIVLESKELYEIIYNRLNGDLFMWEPRSPIYKNLEPNNIDRRSNEGDFLINMDSKLHNKSLSDKTYANVHESTFYEKAILAKVNDMFSLELCVKEGNLIMFTDVPDVEKTEKKSSRGKLQFNLKEFRLFSVTGFNNDKNLGYFCVQLTEAELLHCELAWSDGVDNHLATAWSDNIDKHLNRIILKYSNDQLPINRNEMLSVVAELKKQPSKRLKRIKLAFGINSAIILHRTEYAAHNWIYQLIDFFNVAEFPIEAYEPFALVSEIQGHTWSLAIEYRPKSFPYRAFVDIGYCTLGSNIIYPMTGCTLRMLTEDCILSIGPVVESTGQCNESINCEGLIPVMNAGLLNISIRLSDESKIFPNIDLRSSIHDVHLKTCYDSADTLAQLIAYIANDKDLVSTDKKIDENKNNSRANWSKHGKDETLMHINKLMADAVKDAEISPTSYTSNKMKDTTKIHSYETASSRITSSSCNNSLDECNILNFEPNELLTACCPQEELENSLPQIDDELGATASYSVPTLEDFYFIHDNEIFFMDKCGIDEVFLSEDPLQIVDNHFCLPSEKKDLLRPPVHFPKSEESYTLCEMTFTWHLFGGMDFPELCAKPKTNGNTSSSPAAEMSDTYKQAVSHGSNESHKKSSKIILGKSKKSQRNSDVLVEIQLTKIRFSHDKYPTNSLYSSRQVLIIAEIEIRDRLISSDINKLLYHPFQNNIPQKNNENMITVKALNVRSNPNKQRANECSLKVSILPIRLNIDQDTLMFLEEFFSALIERSKNVSTTSPYDFDLYRDVPVMTVNGMSSVPNEFKATEIDRNSPEHVEDSTSKCNEPCEDSSASDPIYFKDFVFSPALPICFDYHGRRIELSRGPITGLVMGLAQLQGSGIILREVVNRRGLLGWNKLFEFLCKEWLKDIKRNQLPNILSGIGPTNAVLQLFQGFFDLFRLPLQQYNKDGRIIRGFQLGAQSFSARTAFAALEITSRIIHLLQFTAETTFDILSAGPSLNRRRKLKLGKRRQGRPKDIREGVANAYTIVKEGINESANTLMEAAVVEHDQKGYTGAVGAVVRQIPQLVVCPAVLATQATNNILGGAKSSLVPEAKREARNKWKHEKI